MSAPFDTTTNTAATAPTFIIGMSSTAVTSSAERERTDFCPVEPDSWDAVGVHQNDVGGIIMRFLANAGQATGRAISEQLKLPFGLIQDLLRVLKSQLFLQFRGGSLVGDYEYELSSQGLDRARRLADQCTYCGSAPVSFDAYVASVRQQSIYRIRVRRTHLREAFHDMLLNDAMLDQIGQAIGTAQGLFLYGAPGNGKSSVAERLMRAIGDTIWIPRTISIAGDLIRLYDPATHVEVRSTESDELFGNSNVDRRWVRIRRPTVTVGGELTLGLFDVQYNPARGINEAPLQLKSNGGVLVVDDFGRQRVSTSEILNRMIVPLEKRFDLVSMPSGRQIQIPFDSMLAFATNLEPRQLFDEAFLRRLPYKVCFNDPTPAEFRQLFESLARQLNIKFDEVSYQRLLTKHYGPRQLAVRFCHPRDLLTQVATLCDYHEIPREMTPEVIDVVAHNYLAGF